MGLKKMIIGMLLLGLLVGCKEKHVSKEEETFGELMVYDMPFLDAELKLYDFGLSDDFFAQKDLFQEAVLTVQELYKDRGYYDMTQEELDPILIQLKQLKVDSVFDVSCSSQFRYQIEQESPYFIIPFYKGGTYQLSASIFYVYTLVPEMMIAVEQELKDQGYQPIENEKGWYQDYRMGSLRAQENTVLLKLFLENKQAFQQAVDQVETDGFLHIEVLSSKKEYKTINESINETNITLERRSKNDEFTEHLIYDFDGILTDEERITTYQVQIDEHWFYGHTIINHD